MSPSRRATIGITGAVALTLVSGCTTSGVVSSGSDGTEQSNAGDGETAFEARLSGPEIDRLLFDGTGVTAVGEVHERDSSTRLPVTLTDDATANVVEVFRTVGVDETPERFRIVLLGDDGEIDRFGIGPAFAENVAGDGWDGEFVLVFEQREDAREVRETLACLAGNSGTACEVS